jgi:hypothetical protein
MAQRRTKVKRERGNHTEAPPALGPGTAGLSALGTAAAEATSNNPTAEECPKKKKKTAHDKLKEATTAVDEATKVFNAAEAALAKHSRSMASHASLSGGHSSGVLGWHKTRARIKNRVLFVLFHVECNTQKMV